MLRKYFDERIARAAEIDPAYAVLWQAMAKFTEGGGKRLRPYLTVLGYEAFDGADYGKILQLAAAQELLHLSLLIHDDLMDRDYERYGHDNIAGIFRKKYARAAASSEQADHNAQGTALLAGDLLLADAHQLVMQSGFSEAQKAKASDLLKTVMFEVVGGQLLDVQGGMQAFDKVDSIKVARYKTASYSFIGPLCVGATMAGATEKMLGLMELFAEQAGVAYQLQDDMLGLFGGSASGMRSLSDLREGKRTYLMQQAMQRATPSGRKILEQSLGNEAATEDDLEAVRTMVASCGAKAQAQEQIATYTKKALTYLSELKIRESEREALAGLIKSGLERDK